MLRSMFLILLLIASAPMAAQVTTAFTYQGELERSDVAADGDFDFRFQLYDVANGGIQVVAPAEIPAVTVRAGLFTVEVDFGFNVFGITDLWLELQVRDAGSTGGYTSLLPRQKITPTPIATHAMNVEEGAIGSEQISPGAVGSVQISDGAIGGSKIAPGAVGADQLANGAVGSAQIADAAVGAVQIADGAVGSLEIAAGAVGSAQIAGAAVGATQIEDGSVGSLEIADGAVGAAEVDATEIQLRISNSCTPGSFVRAISASGTLTCEPDAGLVAVTGADIVDGSISTADLAPGSVDAVRIDSSQVQRRVVGTCSSDQAMRTVGQNGAVGCVDLPPGGDITGISTGSTSGLDGGCTSGTCTLAVDPTDWNGADPVSSASTNVGVLTDGTTAWTTIETVNIVSPIGRPGEVLLMGNLRVDCSNCQSPERLTTCEIGFTSSAMGTPGSSGRSRAVVGSQNGVFLRENVGNVDEMAQGAGVSSTYYLRGRSAGGNSICRFDDINVGGIFVPD